MSYIPASSQGDLWAVIGGLLAMALGLGWWVRRGERGADDPPVDDAFDPPADATADPAPRNGAAPV